MTYLYMAIAVFLVFVAFQALYVLIPIFLDERKRKVLSLKEHSFSVIVPAYNEAIVIENCIMGFLQTKHQNAEMVIINDGSTDTTLVTLKKRLKLQPYAKPFDTPLPHKEILTVYRSETAKNIYVIDKLNGGKADALNAGINFAKNEIVLTLDADSILAPDSLSEMNDAFKEKNVVACGGNVMISQAFQGDHGNLKPHFKMKGILRYQFLQYLTDFYLYKRAQASLGTMSVISGAFGAFQKELLLKINGFRCTVGEDMDITLKLHKYIKENGRKERITFVPSAICYTEAPSSIKDLFKQRVRWQKAFIDCLLHYRTCYFHKFSKRFSFFFLVDQFLIGTLNGFPVIAAPFLLMLNSSHYLFMLMLLTIAFFLFSYQRLTTLYISHMHQIKFSKADLARIILFLPIEIFFFRVLNLIFVLYGTLTYLYKPHSWNKFERTGTLAVKGVRRA
ncbi:glycosyltransferase family 2 protein [Rossellomorea vietnamensis]|uniref:Glycosyltransferase family 2 protein n=1 Tax=Rossellomorea vietnamensis TaxID=218284 RepID=A0A5D4LYF6_9BACI|nr:glycosyltransferase [Rossellomorea vietnamensis]TYR94292.1 glycosyltransferase family 2 protein [Rossellomorea vietnamensis]